MLRGCWGFGGRGVLSAFLVTLEDFDLNRCETTRFRLHSTNLKLRILCDSFKKNKYKNSDNRFNLVTGH